MSQSQFLHTQVKAAACIEETRDDGADNTVDLPMHYMTCSASHHGNLINWQSWPLIMYMYFVDTQLCGEKLSVQETASAASTRKTCKWIFLMMIFS